MKALAIGFLTALFLLIGPTAMACRVCRPRVQAAIHTPEYSANLLTLLLPVGALLLLAAGVFYAPLIKARFLSSTSHG
ncbi:hypothetical protein [Hymenobacter wooponensis]|uniref:Uncharacterized protein n=1 Tax=Hymenobacter wooponensis TaxID=1525360 RepID=A0A4Z0MU88_9BACT|nr:hypothetical protein [Hymenobacter wooponensis]TGD83231.1 hypothetical protein EU557_05485 [Hymenobacter wooponensis]